MLRNYFLLTVRILFKHRIHSVINILGLALGIALSVLIFSYILFEWSYDTFNTQYRNIYQLIGDNSGSVDEKAKALINANFPDVKESCLLNDFGYDVNWGDKPFWLGHIVETDPSFFKMFKVDFITGNPSTVINDPASIVLSESAAKKIFGNKDPINQTVRLLHTNYFTVTGIFRDIPFNSSIKADAIIKTGKGGRMYSANCMTNDPESCVYFYRIFLLLKGGTSVRQLQTSLSVYLTGHGIQNKEFTLLPLKKLYFSNVTNELGLEKGNISLIRLFFVIAVIILLLACVNYINLSLAGQYQRHKEIAIKKISGVQRKQLIIQCLGESLFITFIATDIGILIAKLIQPFLINLTDTPLNIEMFFKTPYIFGITGLIIVLGLISGAYPAFVLSNYNPLQIFSGLSRNPIKRNILRKSLNVFQFSVAVILVVALIVINRQIKYVKHNDLGFNTHLLLNLRLNWRMQGEISTLKDLLEMDPEIIHVTGSMGIPGEIHMRGGDKDLKSMFSSIYVDSAFLKTFDIQIVEGRPFQPGDLDHTCIVNETFLKANDWDNIIDKNVRGREVIGVIKDFHFTSLKEKITPLCLFYDNIKPDFFSIRMNGNHLSQTMNYIRKSWRETCGQFGFNYRFYDDWFDNMYKKEEKLAKLVSVFAGLAIFISCLGIFGLAEFTCVRRTKEIGIRKVNGASSFGLFYRLSRDFIVWIMVAMVIGSPLAYLIVNKWLENFAYRTPISIWYFLLAGVSIFMIAWIAVSYHTIKAARRNPVDALRYE